jgi:hypothetical protein
MIVDSRLVEWLVRREPGALGVLAHGAPVRGESATGAPLELLLVTRTQLKRQRLAHTRAMLAGRAGNCRIHLDAIASYRVGWLPPGTLQQSLLAGSQAAWGDAAALDVVPRWRPDQLDPRLALDDQAGAEADLAAGWPDYAALRAVGALLIARRAYRPALAGRPEALRRAWPEAPSPDAEPADRFVARARELLVDWLFTWEGAGMVHRGVQRYVALRPAAAAARDI